MSVSFVVVLALLTILGHACELPIEQMAVAHAHADAQDASHHHTDDSQFECEAVLAIPPSTNASPSVGLAVHASPVPMLDTVSLRVVTALPDVSARYQPPPLFLLHAALLI